MPVEFREKFGALRTKARLSGDDIDYLQFTHEKITGLKRAKTLDEVKSALRQYAEGSRKRIAEYARSGERGLGAHMSADELIEKYRSLASHFDNLLVALWNEDIDAVADALNNMDFAPLQANVITGMWQFVNNYKS